MCTVYGDTPNLSYSLSYSSTLCETERFQKLKWLWSTIVDGVISAVVLIYCTACCLDFIIMVARCGGVAIVRLTLVLWYTGMVSCFMDQLFIILITRNGKFLMLTKSHHILVHIQLVLRNLQESFQLEIKDIIAVFRPHLSSSDS